MRPTLTLDAAAAPSSEAGMILVDSSVWVDHLRKGEPGLVDAGLVLAHPRA